MSDIKVNINTIKKEGEYKTKLIVGGNENNKIILETPEPDILGHIELVKSALQLYFDKKIEKNEENRSC
jgi:hypothetical protein